MLAIERRWAEAILTAFAPPGGAGLSAAPGEVDYAGTVERMLSAMTPRAALGMRLALWVAALAPLWLWGRPTTASRLSMDRRTALLRQIAEHRWLVVRELALLLKMAASMALLGVPAVRQRSHYDFGVARPWQVDDGEAWESGPRRKLPLLSVTGATPHNRQGPLEDDADGAAAVEAS